MHHYALALRPISITPIPPLPLPLPSPTAHILRLPLPLPIPAIPIVPNEICFSARRTAYSRSTRRRRLEHHRLLGRELVLRVIFVFVTVATVFVALAAAGGFALGAGFFFVAFVC